jgi:prefoldin beta subunit
MATEKVNQLQLLQQNLHNFLVQKQQLESKLTEIDSAIKELNKTNQAYKIVGKLMVASSQDVLNKELMEEKESTEVRLKNIILQENNIKEKIEKLQQEVIAEMQKTK